MLKSDNEHEESSSTSWGDFFIEREWRFFDAWEGHDLLVDVNCHAFNDTGINIVSVSSSFLSIRINLMLSFSPFQDDLIRDAAPPKFL